MCSVFQRYNLKAIHNITHINDVANSNVLSISKIQSKSNSQPAAVVANKLTECAQYFKDTI